MIAAPFEPTGGTEAFDELIKHVQDEAARVAVIEVMDTAYLVTRWLEGWPGLSYTAADVLGFTRLIMEHHQVAGLRQQVAGLRPLPDMEEEP